MKKYTNTLAISLFVLGIALTIFNSFWLQTILQHFNASLGIFTCFGIVFGIQLLLPDNLNKLPILSLFVTQCYIWIF
jgi:hypothetical protein